MARPEADVSTFQQAAMTVVLLTAVARPVSAAEARQEHAQPFRYHAGNHRDPFMPLVRDGQLVLQGGAGGVETSKPVLYGIIWDAGGQSIALINDAQVKVGETIGQYQVAEIRQDAVVLTGGGEPVVLQIAFDTPPTSPSAPGTAKKSTTKGGERR